MFLWNLLTRCWHKTTVLLDTLKGYLHALHGEKLFFTAFLFIPRSPDKRIEKSVWEGGEGGGSPRMVLHSQHTLITPPPPPPPIFFFPEWFEGFRGGTE